MPMPKSVYDILEDLNDDIAMQIWNCVAKGEDVEAIRQLKAATDLTLKQARDMITALKRDENRLGKGVPDPTDPKNIGHWR